MMKRIYFDNAATTPLHPLVADEMYRLMQKTFGNPSSAHASGREARSVIERARKTIADLLNVSPAEIFFTATGTEADNTAIQSAVHTYGLKHAITSRLEHHAVLHALQALEKAGHITISYVAVDPMGHIDYGHLEQLLKDHPQSLLCLMHANNEIGTLTDIHRVADLCNAYQALFHCDTVQTIGHYPLDLNPLKARSIAGSAHKFHGPKGVGFLYLEAGLKRQPLIYGGAQERHLRGGTENVYGIAGMAKALEIACQDREQHQKHIQTLKSYFIKELRQHFAEVRFNGETDPDKSLYTVLNVSFPPFPWGESLLYSLDAAGICASGGSDCSSGEEGGSHVLAGIGADPARPSVRFSFSRYNTIAEIDVTITKLKELIKPTP